MKVPLSLCALMLLVVFSVASGQAPLHARTDDGKDVLLMPNGTWKYAAAEHGTTSAPKADVYVETIAMAKVDPADKDKPGERTDRLAASDRTIFCVIYLNAARAGTKVRFIWKAVAVEGADNGEFMTVDYLTKPMENRVDGHVTLPRDWPKGKYRVEVYVNGEPGKSLDYTIE